MTKHLARSWEYVFSHYLPSCLDELGTDLKKRLTSFRWQMRNRPHVQQASSFALVDRQARILGKSLTRTEQLKALVNTGQREASRLMVPSICAKMMAAYYRCAGESGERYICLVMH